MTGIGDAMIARAIDCASWPADLQLIVDGVMAAIDAGADLSTEQAIGLGVLIARSAPQPTRDPEEPTLVELAGWSHDAAMILAAKDPWEYGDTLQIRGMLMSTQSVMRAVLAGPAETAAGVQELEDALEALIRQFVADGFVTREGDNITGWDAATYAVEGLKHLIALRKYGERPISPAEIERAMKAFAMVANDLTPEQYDADRAAAAVGPNARALEKSLHAMRAALLAARPTASNEGDNAL
jgi:hypothetical protein